MDKELSAWEKYKESLGESRPWHLLDKENYVEDDLAKERLAICKACPELIKLTTQCKKCGCFMSAKTKLKMASCPIGKW
jgi:predicted Zn-ribbon and HTH transcriptional regulator